MNAKNWKLSLVAARRIVVGSIAAFLSTLALTFGAAQGATLSISESSSAPSLNILASQLTDSSGAHDGSHDYTDNGGPPGETFTVAKNSTLTGFTVLGNNDTGGTNGATWSIQIGKVNPTTGVITPLDTESATYTLSSANDYVTFSLGTPVSLTAGSLYSFSLNTSAGFYGLAHSANNTSTALEYAFNNDQSLGQGGNSAPNRTFNGIANPNGSDYIYVFAAEGSVVPEPGSIAALVGMGSVGLFGLFIRRRRKA